MRLADRSLAATNPLLAVASQLVELVRGRMTASQVLDVAGAEPVRARFGFGDDELERITHWVDLAGIRWGYDADHRSTFGLGGVSANTWAAGRAPGPAGRGDVRARPPAGRPAPSPSTT